MPPVLLGNNGPPNRGDVVALYQIAINKDGGGNVGAQGMVTPENDFRACCTLVFGAAQRCTDPHKFIDEVSAQAKKRLPQPLPPEEPLPTTELNDERTGVTP